MPEPSAAARPPISAHALDTAIGKPARGLPLKLEQRSGGSRGGRYWLLLGSCETNEDGRAPNLLASGYVSQLHCCLSDRNDNQSSTWQHTPVPSRSFATWWVCVVT